MSPLLLPGPPSPYPESMALMTAGTSRRRNRGVPISYLRRAGTLNTNLSTKTAVISVSGISFGSTLVVTGYRREVNGGYVTVTDNGGNTYAVDRNTASSSGSSTGIASCYVYTPPTSITVTWTVTTTTATLHAVDEFAGILTPGATDKVSGNWDVAVGTAYVCGNAAMANNSKGNELVVAAFGPYSSNTVTMTAGSGYTGLTALKNSTNDQLFTEYKILSAIEGSQATAVGGSGGSYTSVIATYRGAL